MSTRRLAVALGLVLCAVTALRAQPSDDPTKLGDHKISDQIAQVSVDDGHTRLFVVQPADTKGPVPTIVLVPGLGCQPEHYQQVTTWLVSHGFNVALFKFNDNESDKAKDWDAALSRVMDQLEKDDKDPANALHDKIDFGRLGIMGHSLGGAVATLAAARDSRFKALAVFGPNAIDQSFLDAARKVKGATIAIDGSLDRIAPPEKFGAVIVARSENPHKAQIVVTGGAHPNSPADYNADYIRDTPRVVFKPNPAFFYWPTPTVEVPILEGIKPIEGDKQRAFGFPFLIAWFKTYVAGEKDTRGFVDGTVAARAKEGGLFTTAEFSDKPADGIPIPVRGAVPANVDVVKPADIGKDSVRAPRVKTPGLTAVLDRGADADPVDHGR